MFAFYFHCAGNDAIISFVLNSKKDFALTAFCPSSHPIIDIN
jgi:hypothetical protein